MNRIKYIGDGQQMEIITLNLHTMCNSQELSVTSVQTLFGKLRQKENTSFFAWLLVQCKILTADKLAARQWPCNQICVLCNQEQETAAHLILHCSFALSVWQKMQIWTQQLVQMPIGYSKIIDWWQKELAQLPKKTRRTKAAFMMYGAWNIWKERNRRIF